MLRDEVPPSSTSALDNFSTHTYESEYCLTFPFSTSFLQQTRFWISCDTLNTLLKKPQKYFLGHIFHLSYLNFSSDSQCKNFGLEGNEMWLAASDDRRVSVWAADWMKEKCDLLDWLTFPAPIYTGVSFYTEL